MYSRKVFINCSDVDEYKLLKPSAFFRYFQDTAVESTEALNLGDKYLMEKGVTWVITRVDVEFIKMPKYGQVVNLITYPGKTKRIIYPRHFFIKDENDNTLVRMSTTWALLNKKDHSVSYIPESEFALDIAQTEEELPLPKHIKVNDEGVKVASRVVRYSDCDLNLHLNNTRYIDFIFDIFDGEFYKTHDIKRIQVDYLSEIYEKEIVDIYKLDSNPYQFIGKVNDRVCFIANVEFINKQ